jgi:exodeoxyribonuclease-3
VLISSWNINSIRARTDRLLGWLEARRPEVLCLQELKCTDEQFPTEAVQALGYHPVVFGQRTYNGVAILSRSPPEAVERGFHDGEDDGQARVLSATVGGLRIACLYAPNGQAVGSAAYQEKLQWYGRLRRWVERRAQPGTSLVLTGDFNVAPEDRDVWDPRVWEGQTLFSLPERAALRTVVEVGLVDSFRKPTPRGTLRWWDYACSDSPNRGLRIDHLRHADAGRAGGGGRHRPGGRKGTQPSDHAPSGRGSSSPASPGRHRIPRLR